MSNLVFNIFTLECKHGPLYNFKNIGDIVILYVSYEDSNYKSHTFKNIEYTIKTLLNIILFTPLTIFANIINYTIIPLIEYIVTPICVNIGCGMYKLIINLDEILI